MGAIGRTGEREGLGLVNNEDIAAIRAKYENASSGPVQIYRADKYRWSLKNDDGCICVIASACIADAECIAAAYNAVPLLCDAVTDLCGALYIAQCSIDELSQALQQFREARFAKLDYLIETVRDA